MQSDGHWTDASSEQGNQLTVSKIGNGELHYFLIYILSAITGVTF
jgi:hypothetical protein